MKFTRLAAHTSSEGFKRRGPYFNPPIILFHQRAKLLFLSTHYPHSTVGGNEILSCKILSQVSTAAVAQSAFLKDHDAHHLQKQRICVKRAYFSTILKDQLYKTFTPFTSDLELLLDHKAVSREENHSNSIIL
jgi:hypothetical protein